MRVQFSYRPDGVCRSSFVKLSTWRCTHVFPIAKATIVGRRPSGSCLRRPRRRAPWVPHSEASAAAHSHRAFTRFGVCAAAALVRAIEAVCVAHGGGEYKPVFRLVRAGQDDYDYAETIAACPALADVVCAAPLRHGRLCGCVWSVRLSLFAHFPCVGGPRSTSGGSCLRRLCCRRSLTARRSAVCLC
jgi:hypothetical protein